MSESLVLILLVAVVGVALVVALLVGLVGRRGRRTPPAVERTEVTAPPEVATEEPAREHPRTPISTVETVPAVERPEGAASRLARLRGPQ